MYTSTGALTSVGKLADKLVLDDFGWWGGLYDLREELGGILGFFDTCGELLGVGKLFVVVVAGEVALGAGVERRGVQRSGLWCLVAL